MKGTCTCSRFFNSMFSKLIRRVEGSLARNLDNSESLFSRRSLLEDAIAGEFCSINADFWFWTMIFSPLPATSLLWLATSERCSLSLSLGCCLQSAGGDVLSEQKLVVKGSVEPSMSQANQEQTVDAHHLVGCWSYDSLSHPHHWDGCWLPFALPPIRCLIRECQSQFATIDRQKSIGNPAASER